MAYIKFFRNKMKTFSTTLIYVNCLLGETSLTELNFRSMEAVQVFCFSTFNIQSKNISAFEDMPALNEMSAFFFLCRKLAIVLFTFSTAITGQTIVFKW